MTPRTVSKLMTVDEEAAWRFPRTSGDSDNQPEDYYQRSAFVQGARWAVETILREEQQ